MASSAKAYRVLSCLKIFLLCFTIVFLCTGVLFLATGIYAWMALNHYADLSPDVNLSMTPAVLCGIGGIVIISGLFGVLSTFKNNKCMINCYCFLLGVVFLSEIAGGLLSIIFINQVESSFRKGFTLAVENYNPAQINPINQAQADLQCCGSNSYEDWQNITWQNHQCRSVSLNISVPTSCCKVGTSQQPDNQTTIENHCSCGSTNNFSNVNTEGCVEILFGSSGQTLYYLIGTAFGLATLQLLGIVLALCLYRQLRVVKDSRRHY